MKTQGGEGMKNVQEEKWEGEPEKKKNKEMTWFETGENWREEKTEESQEAQIAENWRKEKPWKKTREAQRSGEKWRVKKSLEKRWTKRNEMNVVVGHDSAL